MRVCILKSTGRLIEAQWPCTEGTLVDNQVRAGYKASDIEEKLITLTELRTLLRTPEVIAKEQEVIQKKLDIIDALPAWQQVSDTIDGVTTVAGLKVVVKKLARVVYWLAKNKVD